MTEKGDWKKEFNLDTWNDGICSFCGSLEPAKALEMIQRNEPVTPSDVNYKMVMGDKPVFFQHFSVDEWRLLTSLLNAGKITFAFPGYFPVLPYKIKISQGKPMKDQKDVNKAQTPPPHVFDNPKAIDKRNTRPVEQKIIKKSV
jgi:hypothetical protein